MCQPPLYFIANAHNEIYAFYGENESYGQKSEVNKGGGATAPL